MLRRVEVTGDQGGFLSLEMGETSSGIILTAIDGLDPVQASIAASSFAQQDGQQYHSARRESRNIVFGMNLDSRFVPGVSNRQLREQLYSVFSPKQEIKLRFELDDLTVETRGVVENIDAPMFMEKPRAMVSVICPDPDLIDPEVHSQVGEAPTSSTVNYYNIDYQGSVESGFLVDAYMNAGDSATGFTIYQNTPSGESYSLEFVSPLQGLDQVRIGTVPGQKFATVKRGGTTSSILHGISPAATWLKLYPGVNQIGIRAQGQTSMFSYDITYNHRYGGL